MVLVVRIQTRASQVALVVKNPPVSARDIRDAGLIPGLGRSPGGEEWQPTPVFPSSAIPWTEQPSRLQSMGSHDTQAH